jgi:hypothetical protein
VIGNIADRLDGLAVASVVSVNHHLLVINGHYRLGDD